MNHAQKAFLKIKRHPPPASALWAGLLLTLPGLARAETYVVQEDDTLSEIVQNQYGIVHGNFERVLEKNPSITNANTIYPGQEILIDAKSGAKATNELAGDASTAPEPLVTPQTVASPSLLVAPPTTANLISLSPRSPSPHWDLAGGYGATLVVFQQSGDFGGVKASSVSNSLFLRSEVDWADVSAGIDYSRYALTLSADLSNPNATISKCTQVLNIYGQYDGFRLAGRVDQGPTLQLTGGAGIQWSNFTTFSGTLGYHIKHTHEAPEQRPYYYAVGVDGIFTFEVVGSDTLSVSQGTGFGGEIQARFAQGIFRQRQNAPSSPNGQPPASPPQLYFGIQGQADDRYVSYTGAWGSGNSGLTKDSVQEYAAFLFLELNL